MKRIILMAAGLIAASPALAENLEQLKQEIQLLKKEYEQRTQALEDRLEAAEERSVSAEPSRKAPQKNNSFNPALSLILTGSIASFSRSPDDYFLPGFALGDEAGVGDEGFSLGESELTLSANTDQYWRGQLTLALADDNGETSTELEEAYIETLALGNGLTARAGRFFSGIGYLNGKHAHAWNFIDAPLVYRGLFGNQVTQDGLRLNWILPTDHYLELGLEAGNGQSFPAGGSHSGIGDWAFFAKTGGDINASQSWQIGLSHYQADDIEDRETVSHSFSGDSKVNGLDLVYKWAPNGNDTERSLVILGEYFMRDEDGMVNVDGSGSSSYDGNQDGWYVEAVYKFRPHWRSGLRYDQLGSDNSGADTPVLQIAGLLDGGHDPYRSTAMLEWSPSEFSRLRLQYNRDHSTPDADNQFFLQYTHALGSHGAHQY